VKFYCVQLCVCEEGCEININILNGVCLSY